MLYDSLERELAVPRLAPLVLCDRAQHRPRALDDAPLLSVRERLGALDVEQRLDARLRLLRVLPAGPARARGAEVDLREREDDASRDANRLAGHGGHSARVRRVKVGVDAIEIARIRRALERYPAFRERCFTEAERAYCDSRKNPAQSYAGRFAGKEAVGKALGLGVARAFAWRDIEIVGRPKPGVTLHGRARSWADGVAAGAIDLSMTHSRELAVAVAVVADR